MTDLTTAIESARTGQQSTVTVNRGQYTVSVIVEGDPVLFKIKGKHWTVADDVEPWQLADAAKALCHQLGATDAR